METTALLSLLCGVLSLLCLLILHLISPEFKPSWRMIRVCSWAIQMAHNSLLSALGSKFNIPFPVSLECGNNYMGKGGRNFSFYIRDWRDNGWTF